MAHVAVSAIGTDRPGVIAAISGVLNRRSCNLEDSRMMLLRGHFAMVLLVDAPDGVAIEVLEAELVEALGPLHVEAAVRPVEETEGGDFPGAPWTLTVYGSDHPGIVFAITSALADNNVNVEDLSTHVIGDPAHPVYSMVLELTLPEDLDPRTLEAELGRVASDIGVDCTLRRVEADLL